MFLYTYIATVPSRVFHIWKTINVDHIEFVEWFGSTHFAFLLNIAYFKRKPNFLKSRFMARKLTSVYQKQMF